MTASPSQPGNMKPCGWSSAAAQGQNWWCVAYPPLCLGAASETVDDAAQAGQFTSGQAKLVAGDSGPYVLKFKGMELLGKLEGWFS